MNVALFDSKLIELSALIRLFNVTHPDSEAAFLLSHDFNNLKRLYQNIRRDLIHQRWQKEARIPVVSNDELARQLSADCTRATPRAAKALGRELKTLACFLNKEIAKITLDGEVPEALKIRLSNKVFIPVTMLPSKYHRQIYTVIKALEDLPTTFLVSVVGSQVLFALLITLFEQDPKEIFQMMLSRDLDIRIIAPADISEAEFAAAANKLRDIMKVFNPTPVEFSGASSTGRYWTFSDPSTKFDLVLTTTNSEISSATFGAPLFEYASCMFVDYTALQRLARRELYVYGLSAYIQEWNINALAYVMKLRAMLERWRFNFSAEQESEWSRIPRELMCLVRAEFMRKYQATAIDWRIAPEPSPIAPVALDGKHFPALPSSAPPSTSPAPTAATSVITTATTLYSTIARSSAIETKATAPKSATPPAEVKSRPAPTGTWSRPIRFTAQAQADPATKSTLVAMHGSHI